MKKEDMELLQKCASVLLPFSYYSFFEQWADGQFAQSAGTDELIKKTVLALGDSSIDISEIRKEIIERTGEIMCHLDKFALFEYLLARIEDKYNSGVIHFDIYSEIDRLILDISSMKDRTLIQTSIAAIMSQLPVRMTKQKFFDIISENLKIYTGLPKKGVDDFYKNTLSYAGISHKVHKSEKSYYNELEKISEELLMNDFSNLSENEYVSIKKKYNTAAQSIEETVNCFEELIKVVNQIMVIRMTAEYESAEATAITTEMKVMYDSVSEALLCNDPEKVSEETVNMFEQLEGKAEECINRKNRLESRLSGKEDENELRLLCMLLSNSAFADIDDLYADDNEKADTAYIMKLSTEFRDQFTKMIDGESKSITRARMAAVLGQVLPLFDNMNDFKDYMYTTLGKCSNTAEREGSLRQIKALLERKD